MKKCFAYLAAGAAMIAGGCSPREAVFASGSDELHPPAHSWEALDLNIRTFQEGAKMDPGSALTWSLLSGAYLARAKERDSYDDAVQALSAAKKSWSIRQRGNLGAGAKIVQSLLEQHRFKDALAAVEEVQKVDSKYPMFKHLKTDILLELGRYAEAKTYIKANISDFTDSSGSMVQARLSDVTGKPEEALGLMIAAREVARKNPELPSESVAWMNVKVGQQLLKLGRVEEAADEFQAAIDLHPTNWKALLGMSHSAFLRKDWQGVISWGEKAEASAPMIDGIALMGDAYHQMGNDAQAEIHYGEVRTLAGLGGGKTHSHGGHSHSHETTAHGHPLNRQFALFCADHGMWLEEGLKAAREDIKQRADIYAYDALAWAAFKSGLINDAQAAMSKALATGSKDPGLLAHAAEIMK